MNKKILFLNRSFYIYDKIIKEKLENRGFEVLSYSIKPKLSIWKRYSRDSKTMLEKAASMQQEHIMQNINNEKNVVAVFLLAGQDMQANTLHRLKQIFPKAYFLWYLWDNIANLKNYKQISDIFDRIVSFDLIESVQNNISYLPLFYSKKREIKGYKYELSMIASDIDDRLEIIRQICDLQLFSKQYIHLCSGYVKYLKTFSKNRYKGEKIIYPNSLSYSKTINIMEKSLCILDIPAANQTGLTMRTIETLGLKRKLITTNKNIKQYDFYNENNIFVIDKDNLFMPLKEFIFSLISFGTFIFSLLLC